MKLHHFPIAVFAPASGKARRSLGFRRTGTPPVTNATVSSLAKSWMSQRRSDFVRLRNIRYDARPASDKAVVRLTPPTPDPMQTMSIPWAMQMKAISVEEPSRLVQSLTGAILGCGGWVLSRGANDTGTVNMLFEFERQACVEIYGVMIAAGLELSQNGHIRFTELCQCTRSHQQECGTEIASIDLEIQTFPVELMQGARPAEAA